MAPEQQPPVPGTGTWADHFLSWAVGHGEQLDFHGAPVPTRVQALLEAAFIEARQAETDAHAKPEPAIEDRRLEAVANVRHVLPDVMVDDLIRVADYVVTGVDPHLEPCMHGSTIGPPRHVVEISGSDMPEDLLNHLRRIVHRGDLR